MSRLLKRTQTLLTLSLTLASLLITGQSGAEARNTDKRPISYTVGCVEYRNWEQNLVRNNPNLRHYHWNPIYANVQSVRLVGPPNPPPMRGKAPPKKEGAPPGTPKNVVFKAAKERPRFYKRQTASKHVVRPSFYKKPVHQAPSHHNNTSTSIAYKHVAPRLSSRDTNGKLVASNPEGRITAAELEARRKRLQSMMMPKPSPATAIANKLRLPPRRDVYGNIAGRDVNGQLMTRDVNGQLMHKDVQGELVARAVAGTITSPSHIADDSGAFAYESYAAARVDNYNGQQSKAKVKARMAPPNRNY